MLTIWVMTDQFFSLSYCFLEMFYIGIPTRRFPDFERIIDIIQTSKYPDLVLKSDITKSYHGHICDAGFNPTLNEIKDIFDQILDGLDQLSKKNCLHNEIKPSNILYRKTPSGYDVSLSSVGRVNETGGTPGWTAPVFHRKRSIREDIYSAGWICLRLLCVSKELFLSLRSNYIEDVNRPWMTRFRNMTEILFVKKLIDLDLPLTVNHVKDHWNQIKSNVKIIDNRRMIENGVPINSLRLQLNRPR